MAGGGGWGTARKLGRDIIHSMAVYTQKLDYCGYRAPLSVSQYAYLLSPFVRVVPQTSEVLLTFFPLRSMERKEKFKPGVERLPSIDPST